MTEVEEARKVYSDMVLDILGITIECIPSGKGGELIHASFYLPSKEEIIKGLEFLKKNIKNFDNEENKNPPEPASPNSEAD